MLALASIVAISNSPVQAQAPDVEKMLYTNACISKQTGDTHGEGLWVTKSGDDYRLAFVDFESVPNPPVAVEGRVVGDKVSFEVRLNDLLVRFSGTITPAEIKGRFSNDRNVVYFNSEVRWERVVPNSVRPYCK